MRIGDLWYDAIGVRMTSGVEDYKIISIKHGIKAEKFTKFFDSFKTAVQTWEGLEFDDDETLYQPLSLSAFLVMMPGDTLF